MVHGLHEHEVPVGIKQNTEVVVSGALNAAVGAEAAYGVKQVEKKAANAVVIAQDKAAKVFISNARKRLSGFFGESYSTEWGAAGWPSNSTAIPTTQDERFSLINSLKLYFASHAAHESADLGVTSALAATLHTAMSDARAELDQKITEVGLAKVARDNAVANLRKRMEGLIGELATLLSPDDPLWHAFGLNRPADPETPEVPTFTTALPGVPGSVLVDWDDAARAERYRVWIMIVGTDTDFHAVETVFDSDVTLTGLPSGATVKIRVTSANDAGESTPGPEATVVVP